MRRALVATSCVLIAAVVCATTVFSQSRRIGDERAVPVHLKDGEEFTRPIANLIEYGKTLFSANWTDQDGAGRPRSKGTGKSLSDSSLPLTGLRAFNRVSGPDANSCMGCHRQPFQQPGGGGDFVANVFQRADRFDFATFDRRDLTPTKGSLDERGNAVTLQSVGNLRATPALYGAGYVEMLAREMTADLRALRDTIQPAQSKALTTKGVSFGRLARRADGAWDTRKVEGLPPQSVASTAGPPSLIVRPWLQSGTAVSLREVTNYSFNQHLGMQSAERFGVGTDPDGDGVKNELTRADVTAIVLFQATLPVPGRVIPNDPAVEQAVSLGETVFDRIRCTSCHVPALPLERTGSKYSEPNPYNPAGNLRRGVVPVLTVDLDSPNLPTPRLSPSHTQPGVIDVPAYTDFKLHDITNPADPEAKEPLDINRQEGSAAFLAGNRHFLTARLWGAANQPPFFHHGLFTTLREAILAHDGEACEQRVAFERLSTSEQNALVRFLESLQVLPPGTKARIVDEHFQAKAWPPR